MMQANSRRHQSDDDRMKDLPTSTRICAVTEEHPRTMDVQESPRHRLL